MNEILSTLSEKGGPGSAQRVESIGQLVEDIVNEHRFQVDRSKVDIALDFENGAHAFCCIDGAGLRRAISNLLNNAIEALPAGHGTIRVKVQCNSGFVYISLQDSGVGMPAEVLCQLGKRGMTYGKVGHPVSGTGLGIHQAMTAVQACQGTVEFRSEPGRGTTVEIRLPAAAPPG